MTFDFQEPTERELKKLYGPYPYRLSNDLTGYIDYTFSHPSFKHNTIYNENRRLTDPNDMAKRPLLITKYYLDHPQQFGNAFDNLEANIIKNMWATFLRLHKNLNSKEKLDKYYKLPSATLCGRTEHILDLLLEEVNQVKYIQDCNQLRKRQWKSGYSESELRYYEQLDYM